ncbi:HdeD family acid-resistance protein [Allosalinactinospora lopnorensis]|uniref:HdeD family acid-resistance protein n=1 Tax=Allosalinactinospora lopnorensis TaxID=1352348 RepID=UPI000623F5C1|nr:HdeD family acid-resistance protein [Allosalinactinospora lopnorensis]
MLNDLARHWWVLTVRGAAAIIFGLLAVIWPGITLIALTIVFGVYALADGVLAAVSAIRVRNGNRLPLALEAVFGLGFGAVALVWPGVTVIVLIVLIGAWAFVTGIFEIITAVRLREEIEGEWLLILAGALSVFFGLLVWFWPTTAAVAVAWIIGIYAIVFGAVLVMLSLRVRREGPSVARDNITL